MLFWSWDQNFLRQAFVTRPGEKSQVMESMVCKESHTPAQIILWSKFWFRWSTLTLPTTLTAKRNCFLSVPVQNQKNKDKSSLQSTRAHIEWEKLFTHARKLVSTVFIWFGNVRWHWHPGLFLWWMTGFWLMISVVLISQRGATRIITRLERNTQEQIQVGCTHAGTEQTFWEGTNVMKSENISARNSLICYQNPNSSIFILINGSHFVPTRRHFRIFLRKRQREHPYRPDLESWWQLTSVENLTQTFPPDEEKKLIFESIYANEGMNKKSQISCIWPSDTCILGWLNHCRVFCVTKIFEKKKALQINRRVQEVAGWCDRLSMFENLMTYHKFTCRWQQNGCHNAAPSCLFDHVGWAWLMLCAIRSAVLICLVVSHDCVSLWHQNQIWAQQRRQLRFRSSDIW